MRFSTFLACSEGCVYNARSHGDKGRNCLVLKNFQGLEGLAGVPEGGAPFLHLGACLPEVELVLGQLSSLVIFLAGASASHQIDAQGLDREGSVSCLSQNTHPPSRAPPLPPQHIPKAPGQGLWLTIALNSQQILPLFFLKASGRDRVTALGKGLENVV